MTKRRQKLYIMLVIAFVVFVFIGLFLWQERTQTQSKTAPQFEAGASQPLTITEIGKTFTKPTTLGTVTYRMNTANSIYIYSSAYELLDQRCRGRHIAELSLSNTQTTPDDIRIEGDYEFARLTLHPMGRCADGVSQEQALYTALTDMLHKP